MTPIFRAIKRRFILSIKVYRCSDLNNYTLYSIVFVSICAGGGEYNNQFEYIGLDKNIDNIKTK